ncbi:hypothetical protein [Acetobacterium sp. K1/6]|jgi:lambda repressor-like predicted transcriptional regulator|uniref:hypothetical protein n=1 Tax=Acetobacterium sp. K1/6 TaxID=3055467 RepID=UPI002ACAAB9B|nr:hypothetical protein [Acetobacterium sp. K1/6]MDZ5724910.1 hypothetical protein [Acetobacterium sp. K1/6]
MKDRTKKALNKGISLGVIVGAAAYGAVKKDWKPLAAVAALHATEYAIVGRKIGKAAEVSEPEAVANCMLFGIAWWQPLQEEVKDKMKKAQIMAELEKEGLLVEDKFRDKGCGIRFVNETESNG